MSQLPDDPVRITRLDSGLTIVSERLAHCATVSLGVWIGVRIARRIDPTWFYRLIYLGMLLTGIKLVWDGLKTLL